MRQDEECATKVIWEGEEYCLIEMPNQDLDKKKVVKKKPRPASPQCECAKTTSPSFPSTTVTGPRTGAELPPTTTLATSTTSSSDMELEEAEECEG